jgi:hypothetical protein
MSKKKHAKKVTSASVMQFIHQSLRTDFHCTEEEIQLIDRALVGEAPIEIVDHMLAINAGKVPLRIRPTIHLDMEDGTTQDIRLTNHPMTLLLDYLEERYDKVFSFLYWSALTPPNTPKDFQEVLRLAKKMPLIAKDIEARSFKAKSTEAEGDK